MNDEPYQRNQVEEALWAVQWTGGIPAGGLTASVVFETRIKRLLDLDRIDELPGQGGGRGESYAFSEEKPGRRGRIMGFSAFDVFCLAIGLELLGTGFKQLEVVVLVRVLRDRLHNEFERLARVIEELGPVPYRGPFWPANKAPSLPIITIDGRRSADHRVYAVIQRLDLKERFPLLEQKLARMKKAERPIIVVAEPKFLRGFEALYNELNKDMPLHYRTTMLLELSQLASGVIAWLPKTSAAKRGPK